MDAGRLAGSEVALLRVGMSDGVNIGQDRSDGAFAIEPKPAAACILYPAEGDLFPLGAPVILEGGATDLEDGILTDDSLFIVELESRG